MKSLIRYILKILMKLGPLRAGLRVMSRSGLLAKRWTMRLPVEGQFTVQVGQSSFVYQSLASDQIGRSLYWYGAGGLERETLEVFAKLLEDAEIFADIGANTGHFSLYAGASHPDLTLYAFEPVPRVYERLKVNLGLNNWHDRCHVVNCAVGAKDDVVQFHIPHDDIPTSASLNPRGFQNLAGDVHDIQITRLDTFFANRGHKPDLIKIDVEGFEPDVLKGMERAFEEGFRPRIILECNEGGPAKELTEIFKPLNYRFYHLGQNGPFLRDEITDEGEFRNWVVVVDPL